MSEQICDWQLRHPAEQKEEVKKTPLDGLLAAEILSDIEALLGRQSLEQLDLEALEIAEDEKLDVTPVCKQALPSTLYLGVDGTAIPVRAEELRGRSGKQPEWIVHDPRGEVVHGVERRNPRR